MNVARNFLLCIICPVNHCLTVTISMPDRNNIVPCPLSIVMKRTDILLLEESMPQICKSSVVSSSRSQSNMDSIFLLYYLLLGDTCTLLSFMSQKHKTS